MNKKINLKLIKIYLIIFLIISTIYSFNEERKGFTLGFGFGTGCEFIHPRLIAGGRTAKGNKRINPSLLTDIEFGYNFNNKIEIALKVKGDWQLPYAEIIGININAVNIKYYFKNSFLPFLCDVSFGNSFWFYPFDSTWNKNYNGHGISFSTGIGYEIMKHFIIHLEYQFLNPGKTEIKYQYSISYYLDQRYIINAIRLTIFYMFY